MACARVLREPRNQSDATVVQWAARDPPSVVTANQSSETVGGVTQSKFLRGATGWKLNRDGISQSEPVSTGPGFV